MISRSLCTALLAGTSIMSSGCRGSMVVGPLDDDSATGDDDTLPDDDDMLPDDDDGLPDDDDAAVDFPEGTVGYFLLVGTVQHPQGRFAEAFGYYFIQPDDARDGVPALPSGPSMPRGADYGCEVSLPDSSGGRGQEVVTLDAGPWALFSTVTSQGELWTHNLDRVQADGYLYYVSSQSGNPPAVPPDVLADFEVPGGDDIPPILMSASMPTHAPFPVGQPALETGEDVLVVDRSSGLLFRWEPGGEGGVEIVLAFFDVDLSWSVDCWVEDDGEFDMGPDLLAEMPAGLNGLAWFRRYVQAWYPETSSRPDTLLSGALQHRWFAQMRPGDDSDPGGN